MTDTVETPGVDSKMRILKIATCKSLSGKSTLTYHIGCDDASAIHFRLWANSGKGMFSTMWVSSAAISKLLAKSERISSASLQPLFQNTSKNNCGFTLAIIQAEGLIDKSTENERSYVFGDPAPFLDRINALIASDIALQDDDAPILEESDILPIKKGKSKKP